ncbi:MAG: DUF2975 domain-containing protein [Fidelibacterota bacterium]|nr:MAG: DUF2975 domain-containing protein [Candidatus Neomarinimicrobiota bacterium]
MNRSKVIVSVTGTLLNIFWLLLWIILISVTVIFISAAVNPERSRADLIIPVQFSVMEPGSLRWPGETDLEVSIHRATAELETTGRLPFSVQLLNYSMYLVAIFLNLLILYQLRRVFASLRTGNPFRRENGTRIRWIGAAVVALGLFKAAFGIVSDPLVISRLEVAGIELRSGISLEGEYIFVGFLILVLAEIFRIGAEMKEEQELTI